jgi:phage terminase small subunit
MNLHPTPRTKSIADLKRSGSYTKTRHGGQRSPLPRATPGHPVKPDRLDPVASAAWDDAVAALDDMDITRTVDGAALTQYARLYGETEGIAAQQRDVIATANTLRASLDGLTGPDYTFTVSQITALVTLAAKHTDQLRNGRNAIRLFLVEFGLTPASRSRIRLPEDAPADADQFAALQGKRPA